MKNTYIIKVLMIAFFGITISCSDFLDEDPKGLLTPSTFFQNAEEATLAINNLNENVDKAGANFFLGTDVGVTGRFAHSGASRFGMYDFDVSNSRVRWYDEYGTIRDANLAISSIEKSSLSEEVKGVTIAQALFFRAFQYINLVTVFGNVPYVRDEVTNLEEVSLLGQTDGKVILAEIIQDLDIAINSGYLSNTTWGLNDGRPTVWAARMLKAHAHIWLEEWSEARTELIEVTTNSPHLLHPDYANKYREGNEIHPEIVFGKQYLQDILGGLNTESSPNTRRDRSTIQVACNELGIANGSASYTLRKSFADTYDDNDARKIYNVWDSYIPEGTTTVLQFPAIFMPKLMNAPVPVSDPLFAEEAPTKNTSQPLRIFLFADAYLLLAEAEFMIGGSTQAALDAINAVRLRTSLDLYTSITMQDIRNERAWELCGEGYWGRKRDLIRWGILDETVLAMPAAETAAGADALAIEYAQGEAAIIGGNTPNRYTQYPVPLAELEQSQAIGGGLVQNPLWVD